jgi:phospholipase/carboxylesterase
MNRLMSPQLVTSAVDKLVPQPTSAPGSWPANLGAEASSPVATFAPQHYTAGYAYPLLVWLHDSGNNERELPQVMPHISTRNYVGAAPRGPRRLTGAEPRFEWGSTDQLALETEERIIAAIEHAHARFNVHSERIFLAGVGAGATSALRFALLHPEMIAGVAAFDGALPIGGRPLRRLAAVRNLSLMLATARRSSRYPEAQVCRDLRLLHSAGIGVTLRQYPGADELTTTMLSDLDRWMMGIVSSAGAPVVG